MITSGGTPNLRTLGLIGSVALLIIANAPSGRRLRRSRSTAIAAR